MNALLPVFALIAGSGFLMFAGGVNGLILPLRGSIEGFSAFNLGLIGAAWAVGYAGGCLLAPHMVKRVGHIRSFSVLSALAAIMVLLSILFVRSAVWIPARAVSGFCFAGAAMIVESWLNEQSETANRGKVFGFYTMINLAGTTAGAMVVSLADIAGPDLFVLAALFCCLALLPTALMSTHAPRPLVQAELDLPALWRNSPVAVVICVLIGVSNGAFAAMAPVFADRVDLSAGLVALFIALSLVAGALVQMPVGHFSDRIDRRVVLLAIACVAAAAEIYYLLARPATAMAILAAVAVLGGAYYSMYPVVVAHANDRAAPDAFLRISGGLLLLFGLGAIAGPLLAGIAMAIAGPYALFAVTLAAHLGIIAYTLSRLLLYEAVGADEKGGFISVLPGNISTPETAAMDPRAQDASPDGDPKKADLTPAS